MEIVYEKMYFVEHMQPFIVIWFKLVFEYFLT